MPAQPLLWTARERDETGLYTLRGRYYHPGIGRFLSEDPAGLTAGLNLYAFALNSPVGARDPFGLDASGDSTPNLNDGGFSGWYMGGMGGFSDWFDSTFMGNATQNFGDTWGRYDIGEASAWDVALAGARWGWEAYGVATGVRGLVRAGVQAGWRGVARELVGVDAGVVFAGSGRGGKQARWQQIMNDLKFPRWMRGWIRQEVNSGRGYVRNPPGIELAHWRGHEASTGCSYHSSSPQNPDLHFRQHYGRFPN